MSALVGPGRPSGDQHGSEGKGEAHGGVRLGTMLLFNATVLHHGEQRLTSHHLSGERSVTIGIEQPTACLSIGGRGFRHNDVPMARGGNGMRYTVAAMVLLGSTCLGQAAGLACHDAHGTYVNVSGHVIADPKCVTGRVPAETAICRDGSHSMSEHHAGTCSHHGGVAQWE